MKRILSVLLITALLAATLCLSACGSGNPLAGTYKMKNFTGYRSSVFKANVGEVSLVINDDSTGTLSMIGQTTKVKVDLENEKISFDDGKNYVPYQMEGKTLTIGNDKSNYTITFKKQ